MNSETSQAAPATKKSKVSRLKKLICEVASDSEDDGPSISVAHVDVSKPWKTEFNLYLKTLEAPLASGMSTIQWWGVCKPRHFPKYSFSNCLF